MINVMTLSRGKPICFLLICLVLWLTLACTAPTPSPTATLAGPLARLYTRTPTPTVTPTPTLDPQAVFQQGLAQRETWDLDAALDRFDTSLRLTPNAPVYASRAEVFRLQGRYEEAAADIARALDLDPELPEAWRQKALLNRTEEAWDEALAAVNKWIELDPDDGAAYVLRAQIYAQGFDKPRQALADYDRAILRDPTFDKATLVERWHILAGLGDWQEALLVAHKITTTGSEDPLRYFYRGWSLIQLERLDEAIQMLLFGLHRYPDYPVLLYYALGVAYCERQAWPEAIQALEVALAQLGAQSGPGAPDPPLQVTDADILGRMGVAYLELRQCETGAAIIQRAIAASPDPASWEWAREQSAACYLLLTPTPTPQDTPTP
jgi:tetratricopeptide (TPR) repeat protein